MAALVLVDTSSGEIDTPPEHAEVRRKSVELARTEGVEAAFEYVAANSPMTKEYFRKHPRMRQSLRQRTVETSVDGYVHGWKALWDWAPVTSRLPAIKVPTLIVVGDEDTPFLRPSQVLRTGIRDSQLVVIPHSGHSPHIEQPQAFRQTLRDFLAKHYPRHP